MLTERENILIECLVKDYIAKGNAISSDRLLEKTGLKYSTATIRKDLIKLESLGLVESTHVSSGRVPTVKGYRYYIDNNLKRKPLSKSEQESIKSLIRSNLNESSIISSATEYISELSDFAAVIGSFKNDKKIFNKLEIHELSSNKALAVVYMELSLIHI